MPRAVALSHTQALSYPGSNDLMREDHGVMNRQTEQVSRYITFSPASPRLYHPTLAPTLLPPILHQSATIIHSLFLKLRP